MASSELKRTEAQQRKCQVSNIKYFINLKLDDKSNEYSGDTSITFNFKSDISNKLMIDAITKDIKEIFINNKIFNNYEKDGNRIYIPSNILNDGTNNINVIYSNIYDNTGSGFHKFIDPEDK